MSVFSKRLYKKCLSKLINWWFHWCLASKCWNINLYLPRPLMLIIYMHQRYEYYDGLYLLKHLISYKDNTTDATTGAGTAYPSGAPELIPAFSGSCVVRNLVFCVVICRLLFVLCFLPFYYMSFFDIPILNTPLVCLSSS